MNLRSLQKLTAILSLSTLGCTQMPVIHDSTPVFLDYWKHASSQPPAQQVEGFKNEVRPAFQPFYDFKFAKWKQSGLDPDQELAKVLAEFPGLQEKFRARSLRLTSEIREQLDIFVTEFPDFNKDLDIYITHSLGEMDGGVRTIEGKSYFIFGVDSIVKYHMTGNDAPFFHHELFHVYHLQKYKPVGLIYSSLWFEGLATYMSQVLNPGASNADIMLELPPRLTENCVKDLPFLLEQLRLQLDSSSEEEYRRFFLMSSKDPRVPARAGYYLGYRIARQLAQKYSREQLVTLQGPELRQEIEKAIRILQKP